MCGTLPEKVKTMADSVVTPQLEEQKADRIPRGSAPPALKLSEAMVLAKKIYEQAAGSASYDTFSQITGNSRTSSAFQRKLSALRQYGIIQDTDNIAALTDIGTRIVAPRDVGDDLAATKEAMLRVDYLSKIFERHKGRILPDDQFLKNILIQEIKVPREVADLWIIWFKEAAAAARLLHTRADGKVQVLEGPTASPRNTEDAANTKKEDQAAPPKPPMQSFGELTEHPDQQRLVLIQLGRGRLAKLLLPEDWDASKDLQKLLKMLDLSLGE
jgi:hypothetical protein